MPVGVVPVFRSEEDFIHGCIAYIHVYYIYMLTLAAFAGSCCSSLGVSRTNFDQSRV